MLICATTIGCRNNSINTRKLVSRNLIRTSFVALWLAALIPLPAAALEIQTPAVGLTDVPLAYSVSDVAAGEVVNLSVDGATYTAIADAEGNAAFADVAIRKAGVAGIEVTAGTETATRELRVIPGWVSVLPAILAITIALTLRNVIPALLLGLWIGATALRSFTFEGAGRGLLDSFQVFVTQAIADFDRASIILFTMMIGGMVGIITRNGGMASIVRPSSVVRKRRSVVRLLSGSWA